MRVFPSAKMMKSRIRWLGYSLIALILIVIITILLHPISRMGGNSMCPTIEPGDVLSYQRIRNPQRYGFKRGTMIIFLRDDDPDRSFISRIVAFPGETVELRDGRLIVDGESVNSPLVLKSLRYLNWGKYGQENMSVLVPEEHVYVLCDNSEASLDSRIWGFVPLRNIRGVVWEIKKLSYLRERTSH